MKKLLPRILAGIFFITTILAYVITHNEWDKISKFLWDKYAESMNYIMCVSDLVNDRITNLDICIEYLTPAMDFRDTLIERWYKPDYNYLWDK